MKRWRDRCQDELPFYGLCLVLIVLYAYFAYRRLWLADYWIHAAIVRELAVSLFHPDNPLFQGGPRDISYWPYLAPAALASRWTGASPHVVLGVMGLGNLGLLLFGLRRFVARLSDAGTAAFYSVAFVLLLWGTAPWLISGFVHVDVLYYVLPYPSTFTIGLSLLCLSIEADHLDRPRLRTFVAVTGLSIVVALTHSLTAIFLFIGLGAVTFWKCGFSQPRRYAEAAVAVGGSVLLAGVWPFFPLFEVLASDKYVADRAAHELYELVVERAGPVVLALPFLLARLRSSWRDPLVTTFLGVAAVYLYGLATQNWTYGRVLPYAAMTAQIALGISVAEISRWAEVTAPRVRGGLKVLLGVVACVVYFLIARGFFDAYTEHSSRVTLYHWLQAGRTNPADKFGFLTSKIERSAVVMADLETSTVLPAFGAKVVALPRPAFFEHDYDERKQAVETFFSATATAQQRRAIVDRYAVDYVLLDAESGIPTPTAQDVIAIGGVLVLDVPPVTVFQMGPIPTRRPQSELRSIQPGNG